MGSTRALSRRDFIRRGALAAALPMLTTRMASAQEKTGEHTRPNIIFLLTDDQRWDMMGCAGHPSLKTPNMDFLAEQGVRFRNAFVTTAICAASRASIFTGLYERTHRCTFGTPPLDPKYSATSYPVLLRSAGYRTGFVGKFGVAVPRGTTDAMFDWYRPMGRNPYMKKQPDGSFKHLTDLTMDAAIGFLRQSTAETPFCLSVSFNAPHAEDSDPKQYFWPEAQNGLYEDATIPTPANAEPEFFARQPTFLRESLNRVRWHWRFETPEKARRMTKGYWKMISGVDAAIGRLRQALQQQGLAENTVIMLMGDNGYFLGERGFAGKWLIHEPSIRVPFLLYDPRVPRAERGTVIDKMALNVDVAPTILEFAGIDIPVEMQGRSVAPLLVGKTPPWRREFFYEHLFNHSKIPKCEGIRTEKWTYVRYFEQDPVYEELYDLKKDPAQSHNLAATAAFSNVLSDLRTRTDALRDTYGGPFKPWPPRKPKAGLATEPAGYTEGPHGRAAVFDGRCSLRLGKTPAIPATGDFSWSLWVNIDPKSSPSGVIIGNRRIPGRKDGRQFMKLTPETVQYFNGTSSLRLAHRIPAGKWTHVALVKKGATVTCYADGAKMAEGKADYGMPELPLYIGGDPYAGEAATCRIESASVFGRALTPRDIKALLGHTPVKDGLLTHWTARK